MPNYITEELNDSALVIAMTNFIANAIANDSVLGLDTEEITALTNRYNAFKAAVDDVADIRLQAKSVTADKNDKKSEARALIAQYAKEWRGNPAIPDSLLDLLQLPNHQNTGPRTAPTVPTNLSFSINNVGEVTLKWKRNGNNNRTIFTVETGPSTSGPWSVYDVTSRASSEYNGSTGVETFFRVTAKRNGISSNPSFPISLWANGNGEFFKKLNAA